MKIPVSTICGQSSKQIFIKISEIAI